ncbi:hypothetical protein SFRURICE_021442, partial [Spodoptera frugiperda]
LVIIGYGLSCYGLTFKTQIDHVKQLQTRFLKYLVSKKVRLKCKPNYEKLYNICKILPVHTKVEYLIAMEHLTESISTSAKLCAPINMTGGSQTHSQQRSIAHL